MWGKMSQQHFKAIEHDLLAALGEIQAASHSCDWEEVRSLVHSGEPGVALENLLENLLDSDIAIPRRCRDVLVAAGERMGLDATGRRDVSLSDGRTSK